MNKKNEKKQVEARVRKKKPKLKNASVQLLKRNRLKSNRDITCK